MGGETSHEGDFLVFEGNHYRNGFMYKNFVMSAIVSIHTCIACISHNHFYTCCSYMMESSQRFKSWRSSRPPLKRWSWKVRNLHNNHNTVNSGCSVHLSYKCTLFHKCMLPSWFCYLLFSACTQISTTVCCSTSTLSYD